MKIIQKHGKSKQIKMGLQKPNTRLTDAIINYRQGVPEE